MSALSLSANSVFTVLLFCPAVLARAPEMRSCAGSGALLGPRLPLDIAVMIDPRIDAYASRALDFWSKRLGFAWHRTTSFDECNLDIEYVGLRLVFIGGMNETGRVLGAAALPDSGSYTGIVFVFRHRDGRVYSRTIAHEIGHAFGFRHVTSIGLMSPRSNENWTVTAEEISQARANRIAAKLLRAKNGACCQAILE